MIQRFIYATLVRGLDLVKADPTILEELFKESYSLSTTEVEAIKTLFVEKTPSVIHGFARSDQSMPLYSIILATEKEDEHFLGDDAGMIIDPEDPYYGADCTSTIWEHQYQILCWAEHPDVTTYMYEVAKALFASATPLLVNEGLLDIHLAGSDLSLDPKYIPENLFLRQLTFGCKREFLQTNVLSRLQKAWKVAGIHVDKSGSPSDVGDVKTLVTPYTEE